MRRWTSSVSPRIIGDQHGDRLNLTNNTLVVFSSDNGPARGSPDTPLTLGYDSATGLGYGIAAARGVTGGRKGY